MRKRTDRYGFGARIDALARTGLHEVLRTSGFEKRGRRFVQEGNGLTRVIALQRRSAPAREPGCHIDVVAGIFVPGHLEARGGAPPRGLGRVWDFVLLGVGNLMPREGQNGAWVLSPDDNPAVMDIRVTVEMQAFAFLVAEPFVERFRSRQDVIDYLEQPRPPSEERIWPVLDDQIAAQLAAMQNLRGDRAAAVRTLESVIARRNARRELRLPYLDRLLDFMRR